MPILKVMLSSAPDAAQSARIAATLSQLTEQILLKDAQLTSVAITHQPAQYWYVGGASLAEQGKTSFFLDKLVRDETNTATHKSVYIAAVFDSMRALVGDVHDVS